MLIDLFLPKTQVCTLQLLFEFSNKLINFQSALNGKLSFIRQEAGNSGDDSPSSLVNAIVSRPLEAALIELLKYGLIRRDNRIISVHRVVQEAMNYHSIEDLQASFDAAVSIVCYSDI